MRRPTTVRRAALWSLIAVVAAAGLALALDARPGTGGTGPPDPRSAASELAASSSRPQAVLSTESDQGATTWAGRETRTDRSLLVVALLGLALAALLLRGSAAGLHPPGATPLFLRRRVISLRAPPSALPA